MIEITLEDENWNAIADLEILANRAAAATLPKAEANKEISVLFTDDAALQELNRQWRSIDKPTNVLSFPAPQNQFLPPGEIPSLGDIALSYQTVTREAAEAGKTLHAHTTHLIIHGLLHLLGHDHQSDAEAETMEAREIEILHGLGIANPYRL
jgi:probable rRNA maturation factor